MKNSKILDILNDTPKDVTIFTQKYAEIVIRVHDILKKKRVSQNNLAQSMGKRPSEVSKWLSGSHNLTLRSICKLEAELGEEIISIPKQIEFQSRRTDVSLTVFKNHEKTLSSNFESAAVEIKESVTLTA